MVKHTQFVGQLPTNCLSVFFDHFAGLELNGLKAGNYFRKKARSIRVLNTSLPYSSSQLYKEFALKFQKYGFL